MATEVLTGRTAGNETLVSVVILNYNKKEFLEQCVQSVLDLEWPNLEVLVVDNASSDGSADFVEQRFAGRVPVIRRTVNSPTAGRNQGFAVAKGQYVLSIDNDIVMVDRAAVRRAVDLFADFPNVALLAFKVCSSEHPNEPLPEHWWYSPPRDEWKERFFYTDFFSEGAVMFRAEALRVTGGYDARFFQYSESVDLSLRMIREGYQMLYCPTLTCVELRIRGFLSQKRTAINYLSLRNRLWIVWKHYPLWRGLKFATGRIAVALVRAIRYRWFDHFVRGLFEGIAAPRAIRRERRPLGKQTWQYVSEIRKGIDPLASKKLDVLEVGRPA